MADWQIAVFVVLAFFDAAVYAIDVDYYFSLDMLRTNKNCLTDGATLAHCMMMCKGDVAVCSDEGACICGGHQIRLEKNNLSHKIGRRQPSDDAYEFLPESLLYAPNAKPVLRHHIAHFCPNLDVARDCIRNCMQQGQPAFCGKDHVCYCGHRYTNQDRDSVKNPKQTYKMFKDMYMKYFGTSYNPDADSVRDK